MTMSAKPRSCGHPWIRRRRRMHQFRAGLSATDRGQTDAPKAVPVVKHTSLLMRRSGTDARIPSGGQNPIRVKKPASSLALRYRSSRATGNSIANQPTLPQRPRTRCDRLRNHPSVDARRARRRRPAPLRRQLGLSLVEVSIVTAIILIVSIIGIPAINAYVVENKVPKVAAELQRYVARTKANGQGASDPHAGLNTSNLARAMRNSSVLSVDSTSLSWVAHGLGGNGSSTGLVTVSEAEGGAMFTMTLDAVNDAACPALASVMQRVAERIEITGASSVVAKDTLAATPIVYSPLTADEACASGDVNTFVFTMR